MTDGPASAGAAAHVLVSDVSAPVLSLADRHHLERVLRLRPGTTITVGDGAGAWAVAQLAPNLERLADVHRLAPEPNPITIGIALTKGEKPELVVQKLTELGVDRIVLFPSARSVVRWDSAKAEASLNRLRRVVDSAVCQCRRAWSPTVTFLPTFSDVIALPFAALAAVDGEPFDADRHLTVLVGPEGGWTPQELAVSLPRVALGPHILRAETAAFSIASVACATRYYRR